MKQKKEKFEMLCDRAMIHASHEMFEIYQRYLEDNKSEVAFERMLEHVIEI